MEIRKMTLEFLSEYAALYAGVFNCEPWNDKWTYETAAARIENMINTNTFVGLALYDNTALAGIIFGQKEQFYDGIHFQLQEFCVDAEKQGKGYGSILLNSLEETLKHDKVTNIFLLTSRTPKTEGYYRNKGFKSSENMVLMSKHI